MKHFQIIIFTMFHFSFVSGQNTDDALINEIKFKKNQGVLFNISSPINDSNGSGNFQVKYVVLLADSTLNRYCTTLLIKKDLVKKLVVLLDDEDVDWAANLILYSLTQTNGIELDKYKPSKIDLWRTEKKLFDKNIWFKYLNKMKE